MFTSELAGCCWANPETRTCSARKVRCHCRSRDSTTFDAGSELRYAVSFGVPFAGHFEALAELFGSNAWAELASREATSPEWLVGVKATPNDHLFASLGAGTGILNGVGSPDVRLVLSAGGSFVPGSP